MNGQKQIVSIAPMMDWTDRHCRYFHRCLTHNAWLYTEMVTADAIIHGDRDRLLAHNKVESPLCLQLGGSEPEKLHAAIKLAMPYGFECFNLNVGCPSDRVQTGRFGACLMKEPDLVRDCLSAMQAATPGHISIKCRIGIDDMDDEEGLTRFVEIAKGSGVKTFIIHARKAWLKGLSPKQNRQVPPLNYQRVYQLKVAMPNLEVIINGGIETMEDAKIHLHHVDGVMIGRAAYHTPYQLSEMDKTFYESAKPEVSRMDVAEKMIPYIQSACEEGVRLHQITRHMLGLFHGCPGARAYRQILSSEAVKPGADETCFIKALAAIKPQTEYDIIDNSPSELANS